MDNKEFYREIKRWPLSRRIHKLTINENILNYSHNSFFGGVSKALAKNEITGLRFGVKWISGYKFYIGREFQIFLKNQNNDEILIRFGTLYGYKKKQLGQLYHDILQALWSSFFRDIVKSYCDKILAGNEFELCGVYFNKAGLTIKVSGIIKEEKKFIPWDKLGSHAYVTYYAIYSVDDASNINRGYDYRSQWNAFILKEVVELIQGHRKANQ